MKKILSLFVGLLVISMVFAIEPYYNADVIDLAENNVNLLPKQDFSKLSFMLPLYIKISVLDTQKSLGLEVNKEGFLISDSEKIDVLIEGNNNDFLDLSQINENKNLLQEKIDSDKIIVKPLTFKGKIACEGIEKFYGVKLVKKKDLAQKFASLFVGFAHMFK